MKKHIVVLLAAVLLILICIPLLSASGYTNWRDSSDRLRLMSDLEISAPGGYSLNPAFDPYTNYYTLTVDCAAEWVTFTAHFSETGGGICIDGYCDSYAGGMLERTVYLYGSSRDVEISVTGLDGHSYYYYIHILCDSGDGSSNETGPTESVYVPRTRVSHGYLKGFYQSGGRYYPELDLISVTFEGGYTNEILSKSNESDFLYDEYPLANNCLFYEKYGSSMKRSILDPELISSGRGHISGSSIWNVLYTVIYMEDEVVALIPYLDAGQTQQVITPTPTPPPTPTPTPTPTLRGVTMPPTATPRDSASPVPPPSTETPKPETPKPSITPTLRVTPVPITPAPITPTPGPCAGADSYDFSIPSAQGGVVNLSDYLGKPVVIWLFGTWCEYSLPMYPHMNILSSDYLGHDGYALLGVVMPGFYGEMDTGWAAFQQYKFPKLPILLDRDRWFFEMLKDNNMGTSLPIIIIGNECGEFVEIYSGKRTFYYINQRIRELFPGITQDVKPENFTNTNCPDAGALEGLVMDMYLVAGRENWEFVSISWDPNNPRCAMVCFEFYSAVYPLVGDPYELHWYEYTYCVFDETLQSWIPVAWDWDPDLLHVSSEAWREEPQSGEAPPAQSIDYEYTVNAEGNAVITKYIGSDTVITVPAELDGHQVMEIGDQPFFRGDVTSVDLTMIAPRSLTHIGSDAFGWCEDLTSVRLPLSLWSIGKGAFSVCSSLTSITFPETLNVIEAFAFEYCSALQSVSLPERIDAIQERTFYKCSSLASVTLPGNLQSIGKEAFSGCASLTSMTLPDSLVSIGEDAFDGCGNLTLKVVQNSYAHQYAEENGIPCEFIGSSN